MIRFTKTLTFAVVVALMTACSSTSTWTLCRDRLTPINTDVPAPAKAKP